MIRSCFILLFICFSGQLCSANTLIPLEVFAKHPNYINMKISPTGKYIAFTHGEGTKVILSIMDVKTKRITASFELKENRHVGYFEWVNDERVAFEVATVIGWLDGKRSDPMLYAANADGSKRQTLWDFQQSSLRIVSTLKNNPRHVLALKRHWRDHGTVKLTRLNVYTAKQKYLAGAPREARHTRPGIIDMSVGLDDTVRIAFEYDQGIDEIDRNDDKGFIHYKNSKNVWQKLLLPNKRKYRPEVNFVGFSTDQSIIYFLSNHDLKRKATNALFALDVNSGEIEFLFRHPDVDISGALFGSHKQLIGVYLEPGYPEVHYIENDDNLVDIQFNRSLTKTFKNEYVSVVSRTEKGHSKDLVIRVRSDKNPGTYYIYKGKEGKLSYFASSKPEVDPKLMAAVEPFTMSARDGLKIYGQITIPTNVEESNLPMVVYPHGGPYGAYDRWMWDRRAQMLASRGYLVLQLNFRGSGGYGEDFEDAGSEEWGARMQDDLTDATKWAINAGLADPNRICIHGVSYGGYAAMNAVVKEPSLYKCAIPDAGVYEMAIQWDKADSFKGPKGSERKKAYMEYTIGGYSKVKERSPVYHVSNLTAALLLVHGGSDKRVPIDNAYLLEEKLKAAGKTYQTLYKDEEGHGFQKDENRIELYIKMLSFLDKNIGPEASKKTLKKIID